MKLRTLLVTGAALAATVALAAAQSTPGINNNLATVWTLVWEASTVKPTYSATIVYALPATPTDVCAISGSATKTIRVRRVMLGGISNVVVTEAVSVVRHAAYAALTNGATMTPTKYDSQSGTATASLVDYFLTAPTSTAIGTLTGTLIDAFITFPNTSTGTGTGPQPKEFEFGRFGSAAVLRGTSQVLALNMTGQDGGGKISCTFEWTEE